jgi:hypothetical protein
LIAFYNWLSAQTAWLVLVLTAGLFLLTGLTIWLEVRLRRVEQRYQTLTAGTDGGDLGAVLEDHVRQVLDAVRRVSELDELTQRLEQNGRQHIQRVGFQRYNPFRDAGGDQSFVIALADEDGDGVVVSSLHSRDVTRVYAKPLLAWESAYQLTDEELQAIQQARGER